MHVEEEARRHYTVLAAYYDELMEHVDYDAWTVYALRRLGLPDRAPCARTPLLDLGCGTGTIAVKLAERGYDVIAVDASSEMLAAAERKASEAGVRIRFVQQDIARLDLDLEAPVAAAVSLCDTLNYLIEDGAFAGALRSVAGLIEPGGAFLFDLHTPEWLREMGESVYAWDGDNVSYIWHNEYDEERGVLTMDLTLFARIGPELYRRYEEVHRQRAFGDAEVRLALKEAGFALEGTFGDLSDAPPHERSERVFYLGRTLRRKDA